MTYRLLCVLFMALATYIPRFIPLVFCRKQIKNRFLRSFMYYMPYAVLASLTFPAIFYSTGNLITAIVGAVIAVILSFLKVNLAVVALVCVAVVFGLGFLL